MKCAFLLVPPLPSIYRVPSMNSSMSTTPTQCRTKENEKEFESKQCYTIFGKRDKAQNLLPHRLPESNQYDIPNTYQKQGNLLMVLENSRATRWLCRLGTTHDISIRFSVDIPSSRREFPQFIGIRGTEGPKYVLPRFQKDYFECY